MRQRWLVITLLLSLVACSSVQTSNVPSNAASEDAASPGRVPARTGVPQNSPKSELPKHRAHHHRYHPNESVGGGGNKKAMSVNLGDVALPNGSGIQAINLGIESISITDTSGNVTQVAQYSQPQLVNVLNYQAGATTPIADGIVSMTTYASLTIIVSQSASYFVGPSGLNHPMSFLNGPAQSTAGFGASTSIGQGPTSDDIAITFNNPFNVVDDGTDIDVDFNALESLFPNAGTGYSRPALSVAQSSTEGELSGTVQNNAGSAVFNCVVVAVAGDGSIAATTSTDTSGNFLLHTLAPGNYQLLVYNYYVGASGWTVRAAGADGSGPVNGPGAVASASNSPPVSGPSATVVSGQNTSVGTIAD